MNRVRTFSALVVAGLLLTQPVFAESDKTATRVEKLEERVREVEARLAKLEGASHKQMGMMQEHKHQMDGMNQPMGQAPQQMPQGMPQGNMQQQQPAGGGMPMGDM